MLRKRAIEILLSRISSIIFSNLGGQRKKDSFRCCPFGEGIFVYGVKQKLYNVLGGFTSIIIPCPHLKVFTKFYLFTKPFYASYIKRNFHFLFSLEKLPQILLLLSFLYQ